MGKATKWFRNLLGLKKSHPPVGLKKSHPPVTETPPINRDKRRWSFVKSYREREIATSSIAAKNAAISSSNGGKHNHELVSASETDVEPKNQAIAAAKSAAEEAAATVAWLTNSSGRRSRAQIRNFTSSCREELVAVKIQSAFRGYLARRALRALKGLVRLQALVRGHIERKRTAQWLRQMQALLRAQARARAGRVQVSGSTQSSCKTSHFHNPLKGPPTPEKIEHVVIRSKSGKYEQTSMLKRNGSKSRNRNLFHSTHLAYGSDNYSFTQSKESNHTIPSLSSGEVQSLTPLKFPQDDEYCFTTAENSPQFYSASSRGGSCKRSPFTSAKSSDGSRSYLSGYLDHPNYMAYTESSMAKVRSVSAPKQRTQYERSSSTRQAKFASKAYPGSGRLGRLEMPIGQS